METHVVSIAKGHYELRYYGWRLRDMTNEERYEGYMRSDFRSKKVRTYDRVELVRLKDGLTFEVGSNGWTPTKENT